MSTRERIEELRQEWNVQSSSRAMEIVELCDLALSALDGPKMSRRDYFALAGMHALMSNPSVNLKETPVTLACIEQADSLISALDSDNIVAALDGEESK